MEERQCDRTAYDAICISASGMKGIVQLGAIHEFWTRGQLERVRYFSGSSAGAAIAFLLMVGYSPLDILVSLCDPDFVSRFQTINILNLTAYLGLFPSSFMKSKLQEMAVSKLGSSPTFSELFEQTGGKTLIVTGYNLSEDDVERRKIYFSHSTTPNANVVDAVTISCSIPLVFERITYRGQHLIDGAYTSYIPLSYLQEVVPRNLSILAIFCKSISADSQSSIVGLVLCLLYAAVNMDCKIDNEKHRVDFVEVTSSEDVHALSFNLTSREKIDAFCHGAKQVKNMNQPRRAGNTGRKIKTE